MGIKLQCSISADKLANWCRDIDGNVYSFDPAILDQYFGQHYYDIDTHRVYWEFEDEQLLSIQMLSPDGFYNVFLKNFTLVSEDESLIHISDCDRTC